MSNDFPMIGASYTPLYPEDIAIFAYGNCNSLVYVVSDSVFCIVFVGLDAFLVVVSCLKSLFGQLSMYLPIFN